MSNTPSDASLKRLFTVTIENEIVVLAENKEEAEEIAQDSLGDLDSHSWDAHATPMATLPAGWEADAIPYGPGVKDEPDRTVGTWIERGAAPEYTKLAAKLSTNK